MCALKEESLCELLTEHFRKTEELLAFFRRKFKNNTDLTVLLSILEIKSHELHRILDEWKCNPQVN